MSPPSAARGVRAAVTVACVSLLIGLVAPAAAASTPSDVPADTHQVNGRVRSVAVVGDRVWMGGVFTEVQTGKNAPVENVTNLAALHRQTGAPVTATPLALGGISGAQVWKLAAYGTTVYAAGKFKVTSGGSTYTNLLAFDAVTGALIPSFRPTGVGVSTAVAVTDGVVYAGGSKLVAVDTVTGAPLPGFTTSTIATDGSLRGHNTPPQHRDLQLIGGWLYSACQCDSLTQGGATLGVKALVRFDPVTGLHDPVFTPEGAGSSSFGIAVASDGSDLYLGAGGSDFVARYAPSVGHGSGLVGAQIWKRDTSGSAQAIAVSYGDLIVGGHFVEIADGVGDNCGFRSDDPSTLDPNDECASRNRLAAYTLDGTLQAWDPSVTGNYNGVWTIALDGSSIHIGGEFRKVHGIRQTYYARLD
jgi:hypothetical protein